MDSTICIGQDAYTIITTLYYCIFGIVGLLIGNSYLNDVNSYLFLTGVVALMDIFTNNGHHYVPLSIALGSLGVKLCSEEIKMWSGENIDESEAGGIGGERYHRLPVAILSLAIYLGVCASIIYRSWIGIVVYSILLQVNMLFATLYFFRQGTKHYAVTRTMFVKTSLAVVAGSVGIGMSQYCFSGNWEWLNVFLGLSLSHICYSYFIFINAQILLLLRGRNLMRKTDVKKYSVMYIGYYTGRF